jgi:RHS repeat-associated protein
MFLVDVAKGALCITIPDFYLPGILPVAFRHSYSSAVRSHQGPLGIGWTHPYEFVLYSDQEGYTVRNGPDLLAQFRFDGSAPLLSGSFRLYTDKHRVYVFDSGEHVTYEFIAVTQPAPLSRITDRNNNAITFEYGSFGGVREIRDPFGRRVVFTTAGELITAIEGDIEAPIRFLYDSAGRMISTIINGDEGHRFAYSNDLLVQYVNPDGASYFAEYDQAHRATTTRGMQGIRSRRFSYEDLTTRVEDSFGNITAYHFDERERTVAVTNALGGSKKIVYGDPGGVLERIDETGCSTMVYIRKAHQIIAMDNRFATVMDLSDDSDIVRITDAAGKSWEYNHDAAGNLTGMRTPCGHTWRFAVDGRGYSTEMEAPDGISVRFATSKDGTRFDAVDDENVHWAIQRDDIGRVVRVDANGAILTVAHIGRNEIVITPSGARQERDYNWRGDVTRVSDGSGRTWRLEYDLYGRPWKRVDPLGFVITYSHDQESRIVRAVNENGDRFENQYDPLGRIVKQTAFDGAEARFQYDLAGRLTETVRADGESIVISNGDGVTEERFSSGKVRSTTRNHQDRITSIQDDTGAVARVYDPEGHLIREAVGDTTAKWEYTWHALPLALEVKNRRIEFRYNSGGMLSEVKEGSEFKLEIEHDIAGRTKSTRYPGGLKIHERYDLESRLIEQTATADGTVLLRRRFEYDGAGRLLVRRNDGGPSLHYQHDARGNLSAVHREGTAIRSYAYDPAGNVIERNGAALRVGIGNRLIDTPDGHYLYDAVGRPLQRGEASFAYDSYGRLTAVRKEGSEFLFEYDPLFRRTRKTGPGFDVRTVWAGEDVMQHDATAGKCLRYIYDPRTGALLALAHGSEWYSVVTDDRGEVTELISIAGRTIDWACDPLGFDFEVVRNQLPFSIGVCGLGREWDSETGLVYQRMRYYVPDDARFLQPDPIGVTGAWNVYQFCWNQPFLYIDPLGLACPLSKPECDAIFNKIEARAQEVDERWDAMNRADNVLPWSGAPPVSRATGSFGSVKSHLEEYEVQQRTLGNQLRNYYSGQCQTHEDEARKKSMRGYRKQESRKPVLSPKYPRPYPPEITWRGAAL